MVEVEGMPRFNPAMGSSSLPPHPKTFSGGSCSVLYFCDTLPVFRMCLVPNFYQMETECVVCLVILSLLHMSEFFFFTNTLEKYQTHYSVNSICARQFSLIFPCSHSRLVLSNIVSTSHRGYLNLN